MRSENSKVKMRPLFNLWWGNSFGKHYFLREGKQTTNLASINLTKLSEFPVPVPALYEQQIITAEVEKLLSIAEEIKIAIEINLNRGERLRQSILKKAFSGGLCPRITPLSHSELEIDGKST
jgi:type I restriction enzyme S subunit